MEQNDPNNSILSPHRQKGLNAFPEKAPSLAALLARCCAEKYQKMEWMITITTRLRLYPPTIRIKKIREKGEGHTQEKGPVQYRRHDFKHGVLHYICPFFVGHFKSFQISLIMRKNLNKEKPLRRKKWTKEGRSDVFIFPPHLNIDCPCAFWNHIVVFILVPSESKTYNLALEHMGMGGRNKSEKQLCKWLASNLTPKEKNRRIIPWGKKRRIVVT